MQQFLNILPDLVAEGAHPMQFVRNRLIRVASLARRVNYFVEAATLHEMVILQPMRSVNALRRLRGPHFVEHVLAVVRREARVAVPQTLIEDLVRLSRVKPLFVLRFSVVRCWRSEEVLRMATSEEAKLRLVASACVKIRQLPWRDRKERCSRRFGLKAFLAGIEEFWRCFLS